MSLSGIVGSLIAVFFFGYMGAKVLSRRENRKAEQRGGEAWAARLPREARRVMLDTVERWVSERGGHFDRAVGRIRLEEPPIVVSAFVLADRVSRVLWTSEAPEPGDLSAASIERALESLLDASSEGTLALGEEWNEPPLRALSPESFAALVHDVLTSTFARGIVTHGADPLSGLAHLGVDASDDYNAETQIPANEVWLFLGHIRALARDRAAESTEPAEVIREIVREMMTSDGPGRTWLRPGATERQREVALECTKRKSG